MIYNIKNKYQLIIDFGINLRRIEVRFGVCSRLKDNINHVLLWDFDEIDIHEIFADLRGLQTKYKLPEILIYRSSSNHYHAHCFVSRPFKEIIHILSDTKTIDIDYLKLGVARGYYTLRFSPKNNSVITLFAKLKSIYPNEASYLDVTINKYFTTNI